MSVAKTISKCLYNQRSNVLSKSMMSSITGTKRSSSPTNDEDSTTSPKAPKLEQLKLEKFQNNDSFSIQIVSNGYGHTPKSCLIVNDQTNYLINCGEGVSRILSEQSVTLTQINHLIVTRPAWSCIGGISGFLSNLFGLNDDVKESKGKVQKEVKELKFHAPFRLEDLIKYSITLTKVNKITHHDYMNHSDFEDKNLKIKAIQLTGNESHRDKVFAYLFEIAKSEERKISKQKLKDSGLQHGRWIKEILKGNDYQSENGLVKVKASDLLEVRLLEAKKFLFLDCPDLSYLDSIRKNSSINIDKMHLIVHMGGSEVLNHPAYLEWIESYPDKQCLHVYLDEKYPNIHSHYIHQQQSHLNTIDSRIYPLLPIQQLYLDSTKLTSQKEKDQSIKKKLRIVDGQTNMLFQIRPTLKFITQNIFNFDTIETTACKEATNTETSVFPKILFLGTGSAGSTVSRNSAGIVVNLNEKISLILDCGENTIGQFISFYGNESVDSELVKVQAIFLSHSHLDHFAGLAGFVIRRKTAFENLNIKYKPVYVLYPLSLQNVVSLLSKFISNFEKYIEVVNCNQLAFNNLYSNRYFKITKEKLLNDLNLNSLETVQVNHIPNSFGICLDIKINDSIERPNFKLVYSGDCRPTAGLVSAGKQCDLLIHEATFNEIDQHCALATKHSTDVEAIQVAKDMEAKFTILTHFSQRYSKIFSIDAVQKEANLAIAFDNMIVDSGNLKNLPAHFKHFESIFKKYQDRQRERAYAHFEREELKKNTLIAQGSKS